MESKIKYYQINNNSHVRIYGFYWRKANDAFVRLPEDKLEEVRQLNMGVFQHAHDTAGGQVHFITNTKQLLIKVKLLKQNQLTWMTDVAQGGFDCYVGSDYNNLVYLSTGKFAKNTMDYQTVIFKNLPQQERLVVLNFPLYNGIVELEIGLDQDAFISAPREMPNEKVVIYGTSIVQGGCVSRPGMAYSNILSRKLFREVLNLGFSGSAFGEEEIANIVASIKDVRLFILDYEANASDKQTYENTLEKFINVIRSSHPEAFILLCSQISFNHEVVCEESRYARQLRLNFQVDLFNKLRKLDDKLLFLDCSKIFPNDYYDYTVDGIHPNDIGMEKLAEEIYQKVKNIFKEV